MNKQIIKRADRGQDMTTVSCCLPAKLKSRLAKYCKKQKVSLSEVLRESMIQYLDGLK